MKILQKIRKIIYNQVLTYRYLTGRVKNYQQGEQKAKIKVFGDLISWQFKEKDFNRMYTAFGLNVKGTDQKAYIGKNEIGKLKEKVESNLREQAGYAELDYDVVVKDKFILSSYLQANGFPVLRTKALIKDSKVIHPFGVREDLSLLLEFRDEFVLKNTALEASEGVFICKSEENKVRFNDDLLSLVELSKKLKRGIWIVQDRIKSHQDIQKISSSALNTTRIVTVLDGQRPVYLTGFQAFSVKNAPTDSWDKGSLYVGIDTNKGCLKEYGYSNLSDTQIGMLREHPGSKVRFAGYSIPFLNEAVQLCLNAHKLLYFHFLLGWDVAITDEGPLIVEANENPCMNAVQCVDGGLRKKIADYVLCYTKKAE